MIVWRTTIGPTRTTPASETAQMKNLPFLSKGLMLTPVTVIRDTHGKPNAPFLAMPSSMSLFHRQHQASANARPTPSLLPARTSAWSSATKILSLPASSASIDVCVKLILNGMTRQTSVSALLAIPSTRAPSIVRARAPLRWFLELWEELLAQDR